MGRLGQRSGSWKLPCRHVLNSFFMSLGIAASFAGCTQLSRPSAEAGSDPLLGGVPVKATRPDSNTRGNPNSPVAALPTLPSPGSDLSTASLATGVSRTRDRDNDLRISGPKDRSNNADWAKQPEPAQDNGSGAILGGPKPLDEKDSIQPVARVPERKPDQNIGQPNSKVRSYEDAQNLLKNRGSLWQNLVQIPDTGEWKFKCIMPNPQNARIQRTYEAKGADQLAAVQAVLDQIDREQSGSGQQGRQ